MKIGTFLKCMAIAVSAAIFLFACEEKANSGDISYAINSLYADGSTDVRTTKLIFTVNDNKLELTADDIKINAGFSVIKGGLIKKETVYELTIRSGRTGSIKIGLDPYRGFNGWNAKSVNVYADWYFSGTSKLTITGYYKSVVSLSIPKIIDGVPVTSIRDRAFFNNKLTDIDIPDGVTIIGDSAFAYNELTSITIPDSVTIIGDNAFAYNQLTDITIPDSVAIIGDNAFAYNELTSITIPGGVNIIGDSVFASNQLTCVTISQNATSIGNKAFAYNKLSSVIIPDNVKSIEFNAFINNPLISITIGADVTLVGSSFGNGFESAYNDYGKEKGTYTLSDSNTWDKEP